jgi:hypothetical protein
MQNAAHRGAAPELQMGDVDNRPDSSPALRKAKHPPTAAAPAPTFQVTLRAPSDADAIRLLRAALKVLGRRFGLRCLRVEQVRQ